MARLLLFFVVLVFAVRAVLRLLGFLLRATGAGPRSGNATATASEPGAPGVSEMVQDPACGRFVAIGEAVSGLRDGALQHFCSDVCRRRWLSDAVRG